MTAYANKKRADHNFKINDLLLLSNNKLNLKRPSRIFYYKIGIMLKKLVVFNKIDVRLELTTSFRKHHLFHVNLLAPFKQQLTDQDDIHCPPRLIDININDEQEYEVTLIETFDFVKACLRFLSNSSDILLFENSWEPLKNQRPYY